jgi:hypothetical protein
MSAEESKSKNDDIDNVVEGVGGLYINIAKDFSRFPAGRTPEVGNFSGQRFRKEILIPKLRMALSHGCSLTIVLDGVLGYNSSFLEEAFAGTLRDDESPIRTKEELLKRIRLQGGTRSVQQEIWRYIDAAPSVSDH